MSPNTKLIILPGWEQDRTHWQNILDKLEGEFDAEVIEFPGCGQEPLVSTEWGVPEFAEWLMKKIESEKLKVKNESGSDNDPKTPPYIPGSLETEGQQSGFGGEGGYRCSKIILLGHSFGGRVAHYLAAKYRPEWLEGLILYGAPVIYRPSSKVKSQIALVKFIKKIIPISVIPRSVRQKFYSDDLAQSLDTGKEQIFRRVVGFDQTELLAQNRYPTVLLWGKNDDSASVSLAEEMHSKLPSSELIVLDGLGHNVHLENPNLFYGKLKQILDNNF